LIEIINFLNKKAHRKASLFLWGSTNFRISFGTTSTTEIEKMDAAQLNHCRAVLEDLFKTLSAANPEDPLAYLNQLDQAA